MKKSVGLFLYNPSNMYNPIPLTKNTIPVGDFNDTKLVLKSEDVLNFGVSLSILQK